MTQERCDCLDLKLDAGGLSLDEAHCEPLEEIFKRLQFETITLQSANLKDESAVIIFDMIEYYESARNVNISDNTAIAVRGWQACSHMIKKVKKKSIFQKFYADFSFFIFFFLTDFMPGATRS